MLWLEDLHGQTRTLYQRVGAVWGVGVPLNDFFNQEFCLCLFIDQTWDPPLDL